MANPTDPFALNISGVADLVSNDTNKTDFTRNGLNEGPVGEKYGALTLSMSDEELLKLRDEWEIRYAPYETKIKAIFERNKES